MGHIVPSVLCFNLLTWFAWVVAPLGMAQQHLGAAARSLWIVVAALPTFLAVGAHDFLGDALEARAVAAGSQG